MKRVISLTVLVGALALLGMWLLLAQPYLLLQSSASEKLVFARRGLFAIRFVHSIHHSKVVESFKIDTNGDLLLYETSYESVGVGLPDDSGLGFRLENGRFILQLNRRLQTLQWWVTPVAEQDLKIGKRSWPLTDFAQAGELVELHGWYARGYQVLGYRISKGVLWKKQMTF